MLPYQVGIRIGVLAIKSQWNDEQEHMYGRVTSEDLLHLRLGRCLDGLAPRYWVALGLSASKPVVLTSLAAHFHWRNGQKRSEILLGGAGFANETLQCHGIYFPSYALSP